MARLAEYVCVCVLCPQTGYAQLSKRVFNFLLVTLCVFLLIPVVVHADAALGKYKENENAWKKQAVLPSGLDGIEKETFDGNLDQRLAAAGSDQSLQAPQNQIEEYNVQKAKSVIELQKFRRTSSIAITDSVGKRGTASLINLSPRINSWFLLSLKWADGRDLSYHLENKNPESREIILDPEFPYGLVLAEAGEMHQYDLWSKPSSELNTAPDLPKTYVSLCQNKIYLRKKSRGRKTGKELVTDFLRDHVMARGNHN